MSVYQHRRRPRRELDALVKAAQAYGDATETGQSEPLAGAKTAAELRLAAKRYWYAERQANEPKRAVPEFDEKLWDSLRASSQDQEP